MGDSWGVLGDSWGVVGFCRFSTFFVSEVWWLWFSFEIEGAPLIFSHCRFSCACHVVIFCPFVRILFLYSTCCHEELSDFEQFLWKNVIYGGLPFTLLSKNMSTFLAKCFKIVLYSALYSTLLWKNTNTLLAKGVKILLCDILYSNYFHMPWTHFSKTSRKNK